MFLPRKEFVLPLEREVDVLEFLAFAFQTSDLLLEVLSLVLEGPVRTLEVAVLSHDGLVFVLELRVLTRKRLHIVHDRVEEAPITNE